MFFIKSLILFVLFSSYSFAANITYTPLIASQMSIVERMTENNATQESIASLLKIQNTLYEKSVNSIMSNKNRFTNDIEQYEDEVFSLNKVMAINKRAGNELAVLRDEVALKIYLVLRSQNRMIKAILLALNSDSIEEYEIKLNEIVSSNQQEIQTYFQKDYSDILALDNKSKILEITKKIFMTY